MSRKPVHRRQTRTATTQPATFTRTRKASAKVYPIRFSADEWSTLTAGAKRIAKAEKRTFTVADLIRRALDNYLGRKR